MPVSKRILTGQKICSFETAIMQSRRLKIIHIFRDKKFIILKELLHMIFEYLDVLFVINIIISFLFREKLMIKLELLDVFLCNIHYHSYMFLYDPCTNCFVVYMHGK